MAEACSICGDDEPFHVHDHNGERIERYFTVGRGQTDFQAALAWKDQAGRLRSAARELVKAIDAPNIGIAAARREQAAVEKLRKLL